MYAIKNGDKYFVYFKDRYDSKSKSWTYDPVWDSDLSKSKKFKAKGSVTETINGFISFKNPPNILCYEIVEVEVSYEEKNPTKILDFYKKNRYQKKYILDRMDPVDIIKSR